MLVLKLGEVIECYELVELSKPKRRTKGNQAT